MQSGSAIDEEIQNMTVPTQELPDFGVGEGEAVPSGGTVGDSL
jgi:preprotein translocase subunit SecG